MGAAEWVASVWCAQKRYTQYTFFVGGRCYHDLPSLVQTAAVHTISILESQIQFASSFFVSDLPLG